MKNTPARGYTFTMSKRRIVYVVLAVVAVGALWSVFSGGDNGAPSYEAATVERGTVAHIVSVTGHLEPVMRVSLAFPTGGRVSNLPLEEGEPVEVGTAIAYLDAGTENSALQQAQAQLAQQQALFDDLVAPLRDEERGVKEATVASAETALEQAETSARTAIAHAFVYADDAIREEADELFDHTEGGSPKLGISFTYGTTKYILQADSETELELNTQRADITDKLAAMSLRASDTTITTKDALDATQADLTYIAAFLSGLAEVVNQYMPDDTLAQTVYESFQTSVATARTAISAAESEVSLASKEYTAADSALALAQQDLVLADAGASDEAVAAQQAAVIAAEAAVAAAAELSSDTVLRAPVAGILSRIVPEVGEMATAYSEVAEILTEGAYEVETYIPEADIARVKLGDMARIEFDAFEKTDEFAGEVVRIAFSETVREGGPTYKTTLVLTDYPEHELVLRPGMTTEVDITTSAREDVLYVPVRSVLRDGPRTYVRVFDGKEFVEKNVTTGLRGSEGTIEIVSGLEEGEEIVLFVDEP